MLSIIIRNIKRYKYKSMITLLICVSLVFLLNLYFGNINQNKSQLDNLANITPVSCQITNLNGSRSSIIVIPENVVDGLQASTHIKEPKFTVRLMAGIGEFPIEEWKENLKIFAMGANTATANPGMSADNIKLSPSEQAAFFASSDNICLASESLMNKNNWQIGDTVSLTFYYYDYNDPTQLYCLPLEFIDVKIVGYMTGDIAGADQMPIDILLPLETVRQSYHRNNLPFSADSGEFHLADPLNLNAFKEAMDELGFMEKVPTSQDAYQGNALTINDTVFRSLASQLRQSIDVLSAFFPLICITVVIIGYITSFLLSGSRQKDLALMRGLGVSASKGVSVLFIEQMILVLTGLIIGSIVSLLFAQRLRIIIEVNLIIFAGYLIGSLAALYRMGKHTAMQLLFAKER